MTKKKMIRDLEALSAKLDKIDAPADMMVIVAIEQMYKQEPAMEAFHRILRASLLCAESHGLSMEVIMGRYDDTIH